MKDNGSDILEEVAAALGMAVLFSSYIVLIAPINAALGAFAGWTVSWFYGDTIMAVFAQFGVRGLALWQIGAALGFVGSFMRTRTEVKSK